MELKPSKDIIALAQKIFLKRDQVQSWFAEKGLERTPSFYSSMDLRDSGFKVAPVDCNLYPAGFNNLCPDDLETAPKIVALELLRRFPQFPASADTHVWIVPEAHTTNRFYIENLATLTDIIKRAGYSVSIAWLAHWPSVENHTLESASGRKLVVEPFDQNTKADFIILNNDFSAGYPPWFDELKIPIIPTHKLGWHTRTKGKHFEIYNKLAAEFCALTEIDPFQFQIDTTIVKNVDFSQGMGMDKLESEVAAALSRIQAAYDAHKIERKPFVYVKNNQGTYGMGIMVIHEASEIQTLNRRTKNKMSVGKGNSKIQSVVIQEGIPTSITIDGFSAEPTIYTVGRELVGGFLRANKERDAEDNLNSAGMLFYKLCMTDLRSVELKPLGGPSGCKFKDVPVLELVYGSIARISALATGWELENGANT